jgi:phage baseplate assembly protein W
VHDLVFETIDARMCGQVETAVHVALARWEPRIEVTGIDFDLAEVGEGTLIVTITYRVRATSQLYNLVYPFYVIPAEDAE